MASTTISIRASTATTNQYVDHGGRGGMLPNSPTSLASQSRRLRLSGAKPMNSNTSAVSIGSRSNVHGGTNAGNSSVAHLKQMFEPKQQLQQQESHPSNSQAHGGRSTMTPLSPSRQEQTNHNVDGFGVNHDNNPSHGESRHESAIRTSPGYEKYKNMREERQERHRRLRKDNHFEDIQMESQQDNNVPMNNINSNINDSANQTIINGLSERRRKMAMAKKHARSSVTTSSPQSQSNQYDYNDDFGDTKDYTNPSPNSEGLESHRQQKPQQFTSSSSPSLRLKTKSKRNKKSSKMTTLKDNVKDNKDDSSSDGTNQNSKSPASPSRRRKFELVKESVKQRRQNINPVHNQHQGLQMDNNIYSEKGFREVHTKSNTGTSFDVSSSIMMKLESSRNGNVGNGNNSSTSRTLSTASLSTSTFETFESDIFQIQSQQNNHNQNASNRIGMAVVEESNAGTYPGFSNSRGGGMGGGKTSINNRGAMHMDDFTSSRTDFTKIQQPNNHSSSDLHTHLGHSRPNDESPIQNEKESPNKKKNKKSNKSPSWKRNRSHNNNNQQQQDMLIQQGGRDEEQKLNFNQSPIVQSEHSSPGQSTISQRPQYFAPPNNSTWDDDDETQFNSVTENNDRRRAINADLPMHPLQSHTMSTKSDKSLSFFSSGFTGSSRRVVDLPLTRSSNTYDNIENDDESYNGSIGNGSWTGRMRARQGMQYNPGLLVDKDDSPRNLSPSKKSLYSIEDDAELSHFSASQLLKTHETIVNTPACSDATKGVEEFKKFAKEDPKTAAVGVGVCGALCGALALGTAGFVLAAGAVGACYGVSQLPEDKRLKMKKKASVTVEKISSKTVVASEYMSNSCGNVCGTAQTPNKQTNGENDTTISRSLGPTSIANGDTVDGMKTMSPQHEGMNGGSNRLSPRLVRSKSSQHESMQQDMNALLAPTNSRKFNRLVPACCRMTRITPVNQIHSLDPSLHSRAWLDVMASAWTSRDEKNEAMEEILLLAKDRSLAKMLLEEGILDSLMYILREFFQQYAEKLRLSGKDALPVEAYMGDPNFFHSKLAANCCVALAKAYCSTSVNTEVNDFSHNGGLSLPMSEQVAQLLYEIPHHMAVKVPDAKDGEKKEVFRLTTEMTLNLANDLGSSITSLTFDKLVINMSEE